ncbi:hypothetical protein PICSAR238_04582 [Mycobacterium avium subsp. paratuberculosis]|nr:hypothetical protein PICSAR238_04582 [Mycobacterium avium subsp. paratuberculosis]
MLAALGGLSAFATSTTINHRQQVLTTVLNHTEPLSFAAGRRRDEPPAGMGWFGR